MKSLALLLSMVLSLTSAAAFAQPAIYIRSNGQFVANGNEYPRGFWIPAVEGADAEFNTPEALAEYRMHLEDAKWFGILNWGAVGLFLTYTVVASSNDSFNTGVGLGLFFIPWVAGVIMATKSNRHLLRAINLVNGVPASEARFHLTLPEEPSLERRLNITLASWSF